LRNGSKPVVLQPRDRVLLRNLARFRILDRVQIATLASFHSRSRVNVRLAKLRGAGLVIRYFTSTDTGSRRSIYALSKQGSTEVDMPPVPMTWKPDSIIIGNAFAAHQLTLVDLYIAALRSELTWNTPTAPLSPSIRLIPDVVVKIPNASFFLELDLGTEALSVFARKASYYITLAVSGEFKSVIPHQRFSVLVAASDESRLRALRRTIAKQTQKLFWFATVETIKRQGFWSACWQRPTGDDLSPPGG